jgi:hypothetical protein
LGPLKVVELPNKLPIKHRSSDSQSRISPMDIWFKRELMDAALPPVVARSAGQPPKLELKLLVPLRPVEV